MADQRRSKRIVWPDVDDAVDAAMEIIAPKPEFREECRDNFTWAFLNLLNRHTNAYWDSYPNTQQSKNAANRFGAALERVLHVYKAVEQDLDLNTREGPIAEIEEWFKRCKADARRPAPRRALAQPEKWEAARLALAFLRGFGSRKITVTAKGQFNRLVGALLGNPGGNYTYICRKVFAERAKRRRKPRGSPN